MKNFLITIGGTGAKCLESILHSCIAGLGPEHLWVGMVDQDQANGNVSKSKILLNRYIDLREKLRSTGKDDVSLESEIFKTSISISKDDALWLPLAGADPKLSEVIKYSLLKPELKGLVDCLYDTEEREQNLSEGFRARPNIGAAAMLASVNEQDQSFWQNIYSALEKARGGEEVRIFLISSIFGGTGASGFPNIARKIKNIQNEMNVTGNVHIGGALLLPYFNYQVPDDFTEMHASPDEFLDQTRGALEYYSKLFQHQKIFDQVYVVGWEPLMKLDNFKIGGNLQNNPPLIPELYGALGALKFFDEENKMTGDQQILHIGKSEDDEFKWADLPNISSKIDAKEKIVQLFKFAFTYHWLFAPALTKRSWKKFTNENWFKRHLDRSDVNLGTEAKQALISDLKELSIDIIKWLSDLNLSSERGSGQKFNLLDARSIANYDPAQFSDRIKLAENLTSEQKKQFSRLFYDSYNSSLRDVMANLSYKKKIKEQSGLGSFVDTLFRSCI